MTIGALLIAAPALGQEYTFTHLAGTPGGPGYVDDTGSAARLSYPSSVARAADGSLYFADQRACVLRKVTPAGVVSTVAGSAIECTWRDGSGTSAAFRSIGGMAVAPSGDLYVADISSHTIRRVTPSGVVTTAYGLDREAGTADGTAASARFDLPSALAFDGGGNLYVAQYTHVIRKISAGGVVTTLAGRVGESGSTDGTGIAARFNRPQGLASTAGGTLYVADTSNHTIRAISPTGVVTTLAGRAGYRGDDDGTRDTARFYLPEGLALNASGSVLTVVDRANDTIRLVVTATGAVTTLAGNTRGCADGTGAGASFYLPAGLALAPDGTALVADGYCHAIRRVSPAGVVTTLAGLPAVSGASDGTGDRARFFWPVRLAHDGKGTLAVADSLNHTIRKVTIGGVVTTLAGSPGVPGTTDGTRDAARFADPNGITFAGGVFVVADRDNHTIRTVTPSGVVTTVAGRAGVTGADDGQGALARFHKPTGIAADANGVVYVADTMNHTIRRLTPTGHVTTIAGQAGTPGNVDGSASDARFDTPIGLAVDSQGNIYVAESLNPRVRKISTKGVVSTLASPAAVLNDIAIGPFGELYGITADGLTIRRCTPDGTFVIVGGSQLPGSADGAGMDAGFNSASGLAFDPLGRLYIADTANHAIRLGVPLAPTITHVAPATGRTAGGTSVTVTGTNFIPGATTVLFGGTVSPSVTVTSATSLTAVSPAHTAGVASLAVTTVSGTATRASAFTYVAVPTVTSVTPNIGPAAGATPVTIVGSGFVAGARVTFDGTPAASVTVSSATSLTAVSPPHAAGVASVAVTTDGGTGAVASGFTYVAAPTIAGVSPTSGPASGGTTITITGTDFRVGTTAVLVGGVAASSILVASASSLTAAVPAGSPGPATVTVSTIGGSAALPNAFTYTNPTSTDSDGDGLPDAWEQAMGLDDGSASGANGAAGDPDGDGKTNLEERRAGTHPRGTFARYFAEGATGSMFDTRYALLNPGDTTAHVLLRYQKPDGSVIGESRSVLPRHRATIDVGTTSGMGTAEFATAIEADATIVADRTMSWDHVNAYGAHAETAVTAPALTWYLAEGATHSGFDLFYLLQNPNDAAAEVRVQFLRPSGAPLEKTYTLPPTSRTNIWVNLETFPGLGAALASTDVSAVFEVQNGRPIIVERALYLTRGRTFEAGHESAGVTAPATTWFLAEGATGAYFDLFVLIANPNPADALVRVTYLLPNGSTLTRTLTAPGNSRSNIWVDYEQFDMIPGFPLADAAMSTTVESLNDVPIIVERALWWPGPTAATWAEAHNAAGATATGTRWALAEGEVGGDAGKETYILVANTSATAGTAHVTLVLEDGTRLERDYPLPPHSRTNVAVGPDFGSAIAGKRFGAIVESTGSTPARIVVERAMYWNANGVPWAAGTNAVATRLR